MSRTSWSKAHDVNIQDHTSMPFDLYLQITNATPSITSQASVDDCSITVDSIVGVNNGDVITIYEDIYIFQTVVSSTATNTINFSSPLDYGFSTSAEVKVGDWKLNVDGSVSPVTCNLLPPLNGAIDIYRINFNITDASDMDSSKFGGIAALTNGVVVRVNDSYSKNISLIVNNIGFAEQGYYIIYDEKAPAGLYGIRAYKNFSQNNGVAVRLDGRYGDTLNVIIQDDLSDLTLMNVTVCAHLVED